MRHRRVSPAVVAREIGLITGAMLVYFGVRNVTVGSAAAARANAERLLDVERALGIAWEGAIQGQIEGHELLVDFANWVYIWGHWPVILPAAGVLFLTRRGDYLLLRNALFVSGAAGFLFFGLLPLAPPRLLELGLIDTVTEQSSAYRALQPPGLTNQFAAFPSLHAGWNLLLGVCLFWAFTNVVVRLFAIMLPIAMAFAVVATANHYVLDVWAGWAVAIAGLAVALRLENRVRMPISLVSSRTLVPDGPRSARGLADDLGAVSRGASCGQPAERRAHACGLASSVAGGGPQAASRSRRGSPPQATRAAPASLGQVAGRSRVAPTPHARRTARCDTG